VAPNDLFDIERSTARFLRRRHGAASTDLAEFMFQRDRVRLLRHLVAGTYKPRDILRLLAALVADWQAGLLEELARLRAKTARAPGFLLFQAQPSGHHLLATRLFGLGKTSARILTGQRTSVFRFCLTARHYHARYFEPEI